MDDAFAMIDRVIEELEEDRPELGDRLRDARELIRQQLDAVQKRAAKADRSAILRMAGNVASGFVTHLNASEIDEDTEYEIADRARGIARKIIAREDAEAALVEPRKP